MDVGGCSKPSNGVSEEEVESLFQDLTYDPKLNTLWNGI